MKLIKLSVLMFLLLMMAIGINNFYIISSVGDQILESSQVESGGYALLLGAPKQLRSGGINVYYSSRLSTTSELYVSGSVKTIIVSGDTLNILGENEVKLMYDDLVKAGVNTEDIILDKLGNRTWDSITNSKEYVNDKPVVIVSQRFHLERALYMADKQELNAVGVIAKGNMTLKMRIREILSRVKMQIDIAKSL